MKRQKRLFPRSMFGFGSLKKQITVTCIGLLFLSLVAITLINHLFLENYYISRKTRELLKAKETLCTTDFSSYEEEGNIWLAESDGEDSKEKGIQRGSSRQNLSWAVMDPKEDKTICHPSDDWILKSKLFGYVYGLDTDNTGGKILSEDETYLMQMVYDRYSDMEYLECWGYFDSGLYFLIRTPLESIQESVTISNTFYVWVGIVMIILAGILVWFATKGITKPIVELTEISEKMSNLEFDVHYTSHAGNEIDRLGENFNRMSSQLESTLSELKSANLELQEDIEDKIKVDEMRKEFLDNVSHELKTPIALIQGYAEGLRDGLCDDPEDVAMYLDVIIDESQKMNKLVMGLLNLSHLESGRDAPVMERLDLVELIRGVIDSMEIMASQSEATIQFDAQGPIYVWADEFKIGQVVTNYLSNAIHHVCGENVIDIQIHQEGNKARVTVFNSGEPISEKDLPNLWTKFYKADKARTREYGGSGIGLSIVKAILDGMHQEYGVKNYDNGVEFWFTLDLK